MTMLWIDFTRWFSAVSSVVFMELRPHKRRAGERRSHQRRDGLSCSRTLRAPSDDGRLTCRGCRRGERGLMLTCEPDRAFHGIDMMRSTWRHVNVRALVSWPDPER